MFTAREVAELFAFIAHNPIDDQSNFHMPIASLHASFINSKRTENSKPVHMRDFLLFREQEEYDIEDDLLHGDW